MHISERPPADIQLSASGRFFAHMTVHRNHKLIHMWTGDKSGSAGTFYGFIHELIHFIHQMLQTYYVNHCV